MSFAQLHARLSAFKLEGGEHEVLLDNLKGSRERKLAHAVAESCKIPLFRNVSKIFSGSLCHTVAESSSLSLSSKAAKLFRSVFGHSHF